MSPTLTQIITSIIAGLCVASVTGGLIVVKKSGDSHKQDLRDITQKLDRNNERAIESNMHLKQIKEILQENGRLLQDMLHSKWN